MAEILMCTWHHIAIFYWWLTKTFKNDILLKQNFLTSRSWAVISIQSNLVRGFVAQTRFLRFLKQENTKS